MLACQKCHQPLTDGAAQQSLNELEAILLARGSAIAARRKARKSGPLCDRCLPDWQRELDVKDGPAVPVSPAIARLNDACRQLGRDQDARAFE
jgi:hypothetical protein